METANLPAMNKSCCSFWVARLPEFFVNFSQSCKTPRWMLYWWQYISASNLTLVWIPERHSSIAHSICHWSSQQYLGRKGKDSHTAPITNAITVSRTSLLGKNPSRKPKERLPWLKYWSFTIPWIIREQKRLLGSAVSNGFWEIIPLIYIRVLVKQEHVPWIQTHCYPWVWPPDCD